MSTPVFLVETAMEAADYKKFLYIATFCRNKLTLPLVAFIALLGSFFINNDSLTPIRIVLTFLFLFVFAVGVVCFKVEKRNKQRLKTDKTGILGSKAILKFYPEKVVMENPALNSTATLFYTQIFQLLESKDYFIFYLNVNQASLVRKKDLKDVREFRNFIISKFENRYKTIYREKRA